MGKGWEKKGADIYKGDPHECQTWGVGNCHIDSEPFCQARWR